jgi:hypothetical protein
MADYKQTKGVPAFTQRHTHTFNFLKINHLQCYHKIYAFLKVISSCSEANNRTGHRTSQQAYLY